MIANHRLAIVVFLGLSAHGCRMELNSNIKPELVAIEHSRVGWMRKEFAIERGYRTKAMKDSVSAYVLRDWQLGDIDSIGTEWAFYARQSPWRIAGWDEDDPEELTAEDKVAYIESYRVQDHYRWRRQTWRAYEELSCEEAIAFDRSFPTTWTPCDSFPIVRDAQHHQ